jgi:microcompartment protein CcmL/EutN
MSVAMAMIELSSIARGFVAADVVVKHAPVSLRLVRAVSPGKFVLMFSGNEESVRLALDAGLSCCGSDVIDHVWLPGVHAALLHSLETGAAALHAGDSVAIVETTTIAASVRAADAALKAVDIAVVRLQLAMGLGGKAYFVMTGALPDIEAAADAARMHSDGALVALEIIAQPHAEMRGFLGA